MDSTPPHSGGIVLFCFAGIGSASVADSYATRFFYSSLLNIYKIMMFFIGWIIFSFVAGFVGSDRKVGFWGAFLLSIFLSPLIGLIIAFSSKSNTEIQYQEELLRTQKQQQTTLEQMANSNEIEQLFNLMKKGILTEEEFNQKKKSLLG